MRTLVLAVLLTGHASATPYYHVISKSDVFRVFSQKFPVFALKNPQSECIHSGGYKRYALGFIDPVRGHGASRAGSPYLEFLSDCLQEMVPVELEEIHMPHPNISESDPILVNSKNEFENPVILDSESSQVRHRVFSGSEVLLRYFGVDLLMDPEMRKRLVLSDSENPNEIIYRHHQDWGQWSYLDPELKYRMVVHLISEFLGPIEGASSFATSLIDTMNDRVYLAGRTPSVSEAVAELTYLICMDPRFYEIP